MAVLEADVSTCKGGEERGLEFEFVSSVLCQSGISADAQSLYCNNKLLTGATLTLSSLGVKEDDLLLLQRKDPGGSSQGSGHPVG